jgi:hypothetical protein
MVKTIANWRSSGDCYSSTCDALGKSILQRDATANDSGAKPDNISLGKLSD